MTPVMDQAEALERVEGDIDLLREIVQLFLDDLPVRLEEIRKAIERGDAGGLRSAAHSLKGAASNLSAQAVSDAAKRLETAGRDQNFAHVDSAYAVLVTEIDRLTHALGDLV